MTSHFPQLCAFDLETTGVDPNTDHIVTASALLMTQGADYEERHFLADPGMEISPEAQQVHGITTEYAREHGRPHAEVVSEVIGLLYQAWDHGVPVVAFNAAYDLSMLKACDPSFQIRGLVIDPHVVDKAADKYRRGPRKLVPTAAHYGVSLTEQDAHGSGADARAAGEIVWAQFSSDGRHNVLGDQRFATAVGDVSALMQLQVTLRRSIQADLAGYLHRTGKIASVGEVDCGWPIQDSTLAKMG